MTGKLRTSDCVNRKNDARGEDPIERNKNVRQTAEARDERFLFFGALRDGTIEQRSWEGRFSMIRRKRLNGRK